MSHSTTTTWDGGGLPFGVSWQKLMMWLFIVGDAILFASFLAGYGFLRLANPNWPDSGQIFHMSLIGTMTFVLISSSATMAAAVGASRAGQREKATRLVWLTALGGAIFLGMQAYEWSTFIHAGARLSTNPWGVPLFSSCFFVITGFHGTHVASGVLILALTAWRNSTGKASAEGVELAGLYWHFVDLVWVFIFTFFYLV
ncbi:MAG: Cytochrome c oxidase subunit 3 [Verrucomicrobiae bacterium]|nr:Cytochrome c oxidase subunit 3 [Verrucomicrobiae bacterium]